MPNLEIVTTDEDVVTMTIQWNDAEEAFITQCDRDGIRNSLILRPTEAKQTIAALTAFLEGKHRHMSDCALHNSPAYPIDACSCSVTSTHRGGE